MLVQQLDTPAADADLKAAYMAAWHLFSSQGLAINRPLPIDIGIYPVEHLK